MKDDQAPPQFETRGDRFKPLTWETMTPAQQQMTRQVMSGQRGSMQGPYNVLLRSPELGNLAQQFGAHTRFHSSLPLALNELVILLVARQWTCQFVWHAHRRMACGGIADLGELMLDGLAVPQEAFGFPVENGFRHEDARNFLVRRIHCRQLRHALVQLDR